jgi:hypothetical protein
MEHSADILHYALCRVCPYVRSSDAAPGFFTCFQHSVERRSITATSFWNNMLSIAVAIDVQLLATRWIHNWV